VRSDADLLCLLRNGERDNAECPTAAIASASVVSAVKTNACVRGCAEASAMIEPSVPSDDDDAWAGGLISRRIGGNTVAGSTLVRAQGTAQSRAAGRRACRSHHRVHRQTGILHVPDYTDQGRVDASFRTSSHVACGTFSVRPITSPDPKNCFAVSADIIITAGWLASSDSLNRRP
jgi:hypothetical protein